jgi:hypothetical protein
MSRYDQSWWSSETPGASRTLPPVPVTVRLILPGLTGPNLRISQELVGTIVGWHLWMYVSSTVCRGRIDQYKFSMKVSDTVIEFQGLTVVQVSQNQAAVISDPQVR